MESHPHRIASEERKGARELEGADLEEDILKYLLKYFRYAVGGGLTGWGL